MKFLITFLDVCRSITSTTFPIRKWRGTKEIKENEFQTVIQSREV